MLDQTQVEILRAEQRMKDFDLHGVVFSPRHNPSPIRSEPDCINTSSMTLVSVYTSLPSNIPYFEISVQGARCKELSKGMKIQGYAIGAVTSESTDDYQRHEKGQTQESMISPGY